MFASRSERTMRSGAAFFFMLILRSAAGQILDTDFAIIFEDPQTKTPPYANRKTYFGYSLVLFSSPSSTWLQVGAPRANRTEQVNIREPGVVYRCKLPKGPCLYLPIDSIDNEKTDHFFEMKDGGWLGGSQAVHQAGDAVAVCAPRWVNRQRPTDWVMTGACYTSQASAPSGSRWDKHVPLLGYELYYDPERSGKKGIFDYAMGQAGFSAFFPQQNIAADSKSVQLIAGAPGVRIWRGSAVLFSLQNEFLSLLERSTTKLESTPDPVIVLNLDKAGFHQDDYFGYSTTAGRFFSSERLLFAASAPRGHSYFGKVVFFEFPNRTRGPMKVVSTLYGKEFGSYFGASLAVADLSGDGLDDLLVTAPHSAKPKVYIFLGSDKSSMTAPQNAPHFLQGGLNLGDDSQFGAAVTSADLDQDGYSDILVGAPGAARGSGALLIFRGGPDGVRSEKPSQIIFAEDLLPGAPFLNFGASISPPVDIDDNGYPDVAIGAYLSGHSVILRSMAHAKLKATIEGPEQLQRDGHVSFAIDVCLLYSKLRHAPNPSIEVLRIIAADEKFERVHFEEGDSDSSVDIRRMNLSLDRETCHKLNIFVKKGIHNYFDPIEISLNATLSYNRKQDIFEFDKGNPAVSAAESLLRIPFATECGEDSICESDLFVEAEVLDSGSSSFFIGSLNAIKLQVRVSNQGEPAHLTQVRVEIPSPASFARLPPTCRFGSTGSVICDVDVALHKNIVKTLVLEIDVRDFRDSLLQFKIEALTKSEEVSPADNTIFVTLELIVDAKINMFGKSIRDLYSYRDSDENDAAGIVSFDHFYEVQKFGVSPLEDVILSVKIPSAHKLKGRRFTITKIYQPEGYQSGLPFSCRSIGSDRIETRVVRREISRSDVDRLLLEPMRSMSLAEKADVFNREMLANISSDFYSTNKTALDLPTNRTAILTCKSEGIECHELLCFLGPMRQTQAVTRLLVRMELQISGLKDFMKKKDILVLETQGSAYFKNPNSGNGVVNGRSVSVRSVFISSPLTLGVELWIIIVSVVFGVLLLMLAVITLVKAGFFQRTIKKELNALKVAAASRSSVEFRIKNNMDTDKELVEMLESYKYIENEPSGKSPSI